MGTAWSMANHGTDSAIVSQGGGTSPQHLNTGEEPTPTPQIAPFSAPGSIGPLPRPLGTSRLVKVPPQTQGAGITLHGWGIVLILGKIHLQFI